MAEINFINKTSTDLNIDDDHKNLLIMKKHLEEIINIFGKLSYELKSDEYSNEDYVNILVSTVNSIQINIISSVLLNAIPLSKHKVFLEDYFDSCKDNILEAIKDH